MKVVVTAVFLGLFKMLPPRLPLWSGLLMGFTYPCTTGNPIELRQELNIYLDWDVCMHTHECTSWLKKLNIVKFRPSPMLFSTWKHILSLSWTQNLKTTTSQFHYLFFSLKTKHFSWLSTCKQNYFLNIQLISLINRLLLIKAINSFPIRHIHFL